MASTTVFLTATGAQTWQVPSDVLSIFVECYGAGSAGSLGAGGGGGAYSSSTLSVSPLANIYAFIGTGGSGNGGAGGNTWINKSINSPPSLSTDGALAKGSASHSGLSGASGGLASGGVGAVTHSGGSGGSGGTYTYNTIPGGGGGCAGPNGNGANGGSAGAINAFTGGGGGGANGGSAGGAAAGFTSGAGGNGFGGTGGGPGISYTLSAPNDGTVNSGGGGSGGGEGASNDPGGNGAVDASIYGAGNPGPGAGGGGAGSASNLSTVGSTGGTSAGYGAGGGGSSTSGLGGNGIYASGTNGFIAITYTIPNRSGIYSNTSITPVPRFAVSLIEIQPAYTVYGYVNTPGPLGFWRQPEVLAKHPPELQTLPRSNISSSLNIFGPVTPSQLAFWNQPPDIVKAPRTLKTAHGLPTPSALHPDPITPGQLAFYTQSIPLMPPPAEPPYLFQQRSWPPIFSGGTTGSGIIDADDSLLTSILETPAVGTPDDIARRVNLLIPFRWFSLGARIKNAIVGGISDAASWSYSWITYVRQQLRVVSATGPWLDVVAFDYFNSYIMRKQGQSDAIFRSIIQKELIRERVTRPGMVQAITDLTGRTPIIFEPALNGDAGSWDCGAVAWDSGVGAWGDTILPSQSFLTVFRPGLQGIPEVGGWDSGFAAYDVGGQSAWVDQGQVIGAVTDEDIYRTINLTKPTGSVVWTQLQ